MSLCSKKLIRATLVISAIILFFLGIKAGIAWLTHDLYGVGKSVNYAMQTQVKLPTKLSIDKGRIVLHASATGKEIEKEGGDFAKLVEKIQDVLHKDGWKQNSLTNKFAADSPMSTRFALQKKDLLLVAHVKLEADTSKCPKDEPIDFYSNCHLSAAQRKYDVVLEIAFLED